MQSHQRNLDSPIKTVISSECLYIADAERPHGVLLQRVLHALRKTLSMSPKAETKLSFSPVLCHENGHMFAGWAAVAVAQPVLQTSPGVFALCSDIGAKLLASSQRNTPMHDLHVQHILHRLSAPHSQRTVSYTPCHQRAATLALLRYMMPWVRRGITEHKEIICISFPSFQNSASQNTQLR